MFRTSRYSYNLGRTSTTSPTAPKPIQGVPADVVIIDEAASGGTAPEVVGVVSASNAAPVPVRKTRHERRKDQVFNRRLKKRLEKDGTPASIEVLPDGGLHVTVGEEKP